MWVTVDGGWTVDVLGSLCLQLRQSVLRARDPTREV
eukprot:SAG31_NODE_6439_length_2018_cov_2.608650_1_plen_35_part_10